MAESAQQDGRAILSKRPSSELAGILFAVGLLVLFALVMFRALLVPGAYLLTTDDNIGALASRGQGLLQRFISSWNDSVFMGTPGGSLPLNWTNLLSLLLPLRFFSNWIHAIDLVVASLFLLLFLRGQKVGWAAACVGVLTAFWLGSNFTLTYAGHIAKFAILVFAAASIFSLRKMATTGKIAWAILGGGTAGFMMAEQQDVGFFFGLFVGSYALFLLLRMRGMSWVRRVGTLLLPMAVAGLLIAMSPLLTGYGTSVRGVAPVGEQADTQAKWEFATQWSWPPDEIPDLVAPGFTGWRTGEPTGSYWGRLGQSAGWETTGKGFRNFKLDNQYVGAIPILLVLLAVLGASMAKGRPCGHCPDTAVPSAGSRHGEIAFWSVVAVVTLLLSFGKYFPLYHLFYGLPVVSSIRNPNKFLQIFQIAVGILAAHGLDIAIRTGPSMDASGAVRRNWHRRFLVAASVITGIFLLSALMISVTANDLTQKFVADGWGESAPAMVRTMIRSLWHGALMSVCGVGGLAVLLLIKVDAVRKRAAVVCGLVLLVALDAVLLARHYITTLPASLIEANPVTATLKANMGYKRVALTTQQSFYNSWLTYLFPYHDVMTVNVTQMPRMPADYKTFFGAVARSGIPVRYWQLAAVGYVMGPAQIVPVLQKHPLLKDKLEVLLSYDVARAPDGGMAVVPGSREQPGRHVILKLGIPTPRFALAGTWSVVTDAEALERLADPAHRPIEHVLISDAYTDEVPSSPDAGVGGTVEVQAYRSGRIGLRTSAEQATILRLADKYDAGWRVWIDGVPGTVLRCDYLCQGVYLPAGSHEVLLKYTAPTALFWVQVAGILLCVGTGVWLLVGKFRKRSTRPSLAT